MGRHAVIAVHHATKNLLLTKLQEINDQRLINNILPINQMELVHKMIEALTIKQGLK